MSIEPTCETFANKKTRYEQWMYFNKTCFRIKYTIDKSIRQNIPDTDSVKEYLDAIGKKFT